MDRRQPINQEILIGIISDTHGHLLPEVNKVLSGVHAIIHAGDIGNREILDELNKIAPVSAVRGNMDGGKWVNDLPDTDVVEMGGTCLYVLHDLTDLDLDPVAAGFQVVVYGHTHRAVCDRKNGVLYINPGSATFPKINDSASLALMRITGEDLDVRFVDLDRSNR